MKSIARLLDGLPGSRFESDPASPASHGLLPKLRLSQPVAAVPAAKPLLFCLSHLRWDFVWQRPQHLLSRAAVSHRVVVVEEPLFGGSDAARLDISTRPGGIEIAVPRLPEDCGEDEAISLQGKLIDAFLAEVGDCERTFWYYTPMAAAYTRPRAEDLVVFDVMDELSAFRGASPTILERERELLARADVVFTGGLSLYEAKCDRHANVHAFPSSIDAAHFATAREARADAGPGSEAVKPVHLGYFGVIDERLDLDLIANAADLRPDWRFTMVGPVVKIDPATLPIRSNIVWAGPRPYKDLPGELAAWDIGLMPFALNEATRFISPTKTPEYLAAGVPVVSTAIVDVVRTYGAAGLVEIVSSATEMVTAAERLLARPRDTWLSAVDRHLTQGSWDSTWSGMTRLMQDAKESSRAGAIGSTATRQTATSDRGPRTRLPSYDWLIVGAGFAGSVMAERLASVRGERVLVVDRRSHVGGNAFDTLNEDGLLIHRYGPHIFHTNADKVVDYLSTFTTWRPYEHRVLAAVDSQLLPVPINLDTVNKLYGLSLSSDELAAWLAARAEPVAEIRTSEDVVVSTVGRELYEKFFQGYTRKQWGLDPSELDKSVTARVPTRTSRDDRYFTDTFQAMPAQGYTRMFERMLDHPNITVVLGTDYADIQSQIDARRTVFTGPIDEYFGHRFGRLPYRSLNFEHRTLPQEHFQPVAVVNYPQTEDYTRVTEYKHLTGQVHPKTALTYEYPSAEGDPYYPIPRPENQALFKRYEALARATPDVWFVGRLATYRYYNMDQIVAQSLATFDRIDAALPRVDHAGVGVARPSLVAAEAIATMGDPSVGLPASRSALASNQNLKSGTMERA